MREFIIGAVLLSQSLFAPQERVIDRLRHDHLITESFVCRSATDIECVDGLCNKPGVAYWSIEVNGDYAHFNSESLIGPSDRVELYYLPVAAFVEER